MLDMKMLIEGIEGRIARATRSRRTACQRSSPATASPSASPMISAHGDLTFGDGEGVTTARLAECHFNGIVMA